MRPLSYFLVAVAVMTYPASSALSTGGTISGSKETVKLGSALTGVRSLREGETDGGRPLATHKKDGPSHEEEERGWFGSSTSNLAYGAENLDLGLMKAKYLENGELYQQMRGDAAKRYEVYAIWKGTGYSTATVKRAMKKLDTSKDYKIFEKEYKKFKAGDLSFE
ncbi:hypothetical protein PHYPSEUDO_000993 [Phytophthora pseudosyringae]|uniref:RxLR effector protein n=1 Tax=Phytophthora pseudosyringae TaxID=221518 RepID=A0A8T1VWK1_9STRA|nr:hypothetical protein PHYPSEUDO_000993 [Phytophthora pseudosyringae]